MLKTKQIISLLLVLLLVIMGLPAKSFASESNKTYFVEKATQYKNKTYIELYQEDGYSPMDGYIYEQSTCIVNENNKKVELGYEIYEYERVLDDKLLKIGSELDGDTYTIDMYTDNVSIKEFDESIYQTINEEILEYYNIKDNGSISLDDFNIPGGWIAYSIYLDEDDIKYGFYKNGKIVESYTDSYYHVKEFNNGNVYMIIDKYINEGSYVPVLGILDDRGLNEYDMNLSEEDVFEDICISPDGEYIILLKFKSDVEGEYLTEPYSIKKYNSEKNIYEEYSKNIFRSEEYVVSYTIDSNNNLWFITNYNNQKYIKKLEENKLADCRQNSHFNFYKMAIFFFIKIFNDNILKIGVSLRLLDVSFHIQLANFFRFMHEKIRLTSILIFDKPLNFVYLIPCFSFASAKTRSIVSFRLL